jgi:hypothetical protein
MNPRFLGPFASFALYVALAMPSQLCAQEQDGQNAAKPHYKLVYLDTLGGPTSNISCCGILPSVLNDQGKAVGVADTDIPNPNFAIENPILGSCCPPAADPFVNVAVAWQSPVPIKLPVLPGGYNSFANAISNAGFIPGVSETGEIDPRLGVVEVHPTLWFLGGSLIWVLLEATKVPPIRQIILDRLWGSLRMTHLTLSLTLVFRPKVARSCGRTGS